MNRIGALRPPPAAPGPDLRPGDGDPPRVRLSAEDFEVGETERRASAAVCLLVDLSYSMAIRGTWGVAKQTALALHALVLAGRYLDRRPEHDPVVLIVTDGEPTAHLRRDGSSWFDWPPAPETLELTLAEVDKMTRRRASLNIFMLVDDERLTAFVDEVARRNGGRVLSAQPERLGEFVVKDFLRTRRAHKR